MAEYEKKVREVLRRNGYGLHHHGKGDHDVWIHGGSNLKVTVPAKIKSRHTANGILKRAGIDHHF